MTRRGQRGASQPSTIRPTRSSCADDTTAGTSLGVVVGGVRRRAEARSRQPLADERPVVAAALSGVGDDRHARATGGGQQCSLHRVGVAGRPDRHPVAHPDPVERDHAADRSALLGVEPRDVAPGPVVVVLRVAAGLLRAEGDVDRRQPRPAPRRRLGDGEHGSDAGRVVLRTGCLRDRVEVRTDDEVGLGRRRSRAAWPPRSPSDRRARAPPTTPRLVRRRAGAPRRTPCSSAHPRPRRPHGRRPARSPPAARSRPPGAGPHGPRWRGRGRRAGRDRRPRGRAPPWARAWVRSASAPTSGRRTTAPPGRPASPRALCAGTPRPARPGRGRPP